MAHDFNKKDSSNRYASTNELCTGVGGFMDYYPNPNLIPCACCIIQIKFLFITGKSQLN